MHLHLVVEMHFHCARALRAAFACVGIRLLGVLYCLRPTVCVDRERQTCVSDSERLRRRARSYGARARIAAAPLAHVIY